MSEWECWEDYRAGLYASSGIDPERIRQSFDLLTDPDWFLEVAREMMRMWPVAARHNLLHLESSRRAWLGQAACCYAHGSTGAETRAAWGEMTLNEQASANRVAEVVIGQYQRGMIGAETLFDN